MRTDSDGVIFLALSANTKAEATTLTKWGLLFIVVSFFIAGAERIDTSDAGQVVKLYEKLLPLAMLFGIEKQWAAQFATLSSTYQPEWYDTGGKVVGAAMLGSSLDGFSNTLATSIFAPPVSSDGGGGSSGFSSGGSSGGGGGGW